MTVKKCQYKGKTEAQPGSKLPCPVCGALVTAIKTDRGVLILAHNMGKGGYN